MDTQTTSLELDEERDSAGLDPVWALLGGGFLLGILFGAVLIVTGREQPPAPAVPVPATPAIEPSADVGAPPPAENLDPSLRPALSAEDDAERQRLLLQAQNDQMRRELEELRRQLTGESPPSGVSRPDEPAKDGGTNTPPARPRRTSGRSGEASGDETLDYWNRLNDIIRREAELRSAPKAGVTADNAGSFLDARIQAAEYAFREIRGLPTDGIDPEVTALAEQLAHWYEEGRDVAETGRKLLTSGNAQDRQGSGGAAYQAAERQHADRVNAVNAEGERVRRLMSSRYAREFPPLE
jgi:hypothetical protein